MVCVVFQFFTNRIWVFSQGAEGDADTIKQMASFIAGRLFTLVVEELILVIFITWMEFPSLIVKLVAQVLVIIFNYVISKCLVFKS